MISLYFSNAGLPFCSDVAFFDCYAFLHLDLIFACVKLIVAPTIRFWHTHLPHWAPHLYLSYLHARAISLSSGPTGLCRRESIWEENSNLEGFPGDTDFKFASGSAMRLLFHTTWFPPQHAVVIGGHHWSLKLEMFVPATVPTAVCANFQFRARVVVFYLQRYPPMNFVVAPFPHNFHLVPSANLTFRMRALAFDILRKFIIFLIDLLFCYIRSHFLWNGKWVRKMIYRQLFKYWLYNGVK